MLKTDSMYINLPDKNIYIENPLLISKTSKNLEGGR